MKKNNKKNSAQSLLRQLPSVNDLLNSPEIQSNLSILNKSIITQIVREMLSSYREKLKSRKLKEIHHSDLIQSIKEEINSLTQPSLYPVINLTGTLLHTNLGRALLSQESVKAIQEVANSPVNLEYDIQEGERGDRDIHLEKILHYLTGAESATAVNNNAAAVLLSLNTLVEGKEVLVSRGELIEIGGSFRMPEIMKKSGCKLVEVGTTNKTHPKDFENAITKETALLLKVHPSNYRIVGFTKEVSLDELVSIGHKHKIPVMVDLGSGALVDLSQYGLPKEPLVQEMVKSNADVITFSGDKLLGGPQAGLIVGKEKYLSKIKKNPLKRSLRLGKLTIASLESTLRLYLQPDKLSERLPTLHYLSRPIKEIEKIAKETARLFESKYGKIFSVQVKDGFSEVGSGSLSEAKIPTKVIALTPKTGKVQELATQFRKNTPPIIGRVQQGKLILDMRTVENPNTVIPKL